MEIPNVKSVLLDEERNIRYEIMAYRNLTKEEMMMAVGQYQAQKKKGKKLKAGDVVTIITIIGFDGQ